MKTLCLALLCAASLATLAPASAGQAVPDKTTRLKTEEAQHKKMWVAPKHPGFLREPLSLGLQDRGRGITQSGLAPLPGSIYDIHNQYQNLINDRHVAIYAGALRADPAQGVLVVINRGLDPSLVSAPQVYRMGNRQGALEIMAVTRGMLVLRSSAGASFVFPLTKALSLPMRRV